MKGKKVTGGSANKEEEEKKSCFQCTGHERMYVIKGVGGETWARRDE